MDLKEIVRIQREFDQRHGWTPEANDPVAITDFVVRDLVGLFGELGEFANAVKKVQLAQTSELNDILALQSPILKEELVDFMIYIFRFAAHLEVDLESEYLKKLSVNEGRFKRFLVEQSDRNATDHEPR